MTRTTQAYNQINPKTLSQEALNYFLLMAAKGNDDDEILDFILLGADVAYVKNGTSPLYELIKHKNHTMICMLLMWDIKNVLHTEDTLYRLVEANLTKTVRILLDRMDGLSVYYLDKALCIATSNKNFAMTKLLVEYGADCSTENDTPFINAVKNEDIDTIKLFIENGTNCHLRNEKVLELATDTGNIEIVTLLIEKGADCTANNNKAIRIACKNGNLEMVQLFLKNGADCTASRNHALRLLTANKLPETPESLQLLQLLFDNGAGCTDCHNEAIRNAARLGKIKTVKLLIENGADISANEHEALRSAINNNEFDMVVLLIEQGAVCTCCNNKALRMVIELNYIHIFAYFLSTVQLSDETLNSLLVYTINYCSKRLECAELLLKHGADCNVNNGHALLSAIQQNDVETLELLMQYGGTCTQEMFQFAIENYIYDDILELLLKHGAILNNELIDLAIKNENDSLLQFIYTIMF